MLRLWVYVVVRKVLDRHRVHDTGEIVDWHSLSEQLFHVLIHVDDLKCSKIGSLSP